VFDVQARPWVDLDAADAEAVADAVTRCPTGALRYERLDGAEQEQPHRPTVVLPIEDGPLLMVGDLDVRTPDGEQITHEHRLTLCRCGMSRNQPFCDNSHLRRSWESGPTNEPQDDWPPPREGAGAEATKIITKSDASLDLRGHLRIYHSDGRPLAELGRVLLCRCGQSRNKPFCDGSHETAEFCSRPPDLPRDRLEAETPAAFTPNSGVPEPPT
jgi:CDGSH-type Zn-finger protein